MRTGFVNEDGSEFIGDDLLVGVALDYRDVPGGPFSSGTGGGGERGEDREYGEVNYCCFGDGGGMSVVRRCGCN